MRYARSQFKELREFKALENSRCLSDITFLTYTFREFGSVFTTLILIIANSPQLETRQA